MSFSICLKFSVVHRDFSPTSWIDYLLKMYSGVLLFKNSSKIFPIKKFPSLPLKIFLWNSSIWFSCRNFFCFCSLEEKKELKFHNLDLREIFSLVYWKKILNIFHVRLLSKICI